MGPVLLRFIELGLKEPLAYFLGSLSCSLACVMTKYRLTLNHGVCLLALADQVSVDSFIFAVDVHV